MKLWSIFKKSGRKATTANGTGKKRKYGTSQLFNFTKDSYLDRTSRPVYAVIFLLPFIAFYELGTFYINTDVLNQSQIRVVAFVWLQHMLESLGFGGKFAWVAPPLAVIVILLSLQISSGKQWYFWPGDIVPMAIECILLAVPLIVLTMLLSSVGSQDDLSRFDNNRFQQQAVTCSAVQDYNSSKSTVYENEASSRNHLLLANVVTGIGAGIYEELVFRLILICILMLLLQDVLKLNHENAIILSVLISAALFSAHHHVDLLSGRANIVDPFNWTRFAFRTMAGVYFAILYAIRGFGITAGTHAFYNIIAVSITALFFTN
jgi:membrane protease YdiL (CAAX protease family)